MEFSGRILLCLLVAMSSSVIAATDDVPVAPMSPAGCARRCGDIEVQYPFGLEVHCAIHSGFHLNCTKDKVFLNSTLEVMNISVKDNKIWVKTNISRRCYDPSTKAMMPDEKPKIMNITRSNYVLSRHDNKVTVLGCTGFAYMKFHTFMVGCSSTCQTSARNGTCSPTAGCCQVNLARSVQFTQGSFDDPSQSTTQKMWEQHHCQYITVMESKAFNFSTTYVTSTAFYDNGNARVPVVMEWGISKKKCNKSAETDKDVPYACVANNSNCVNNDAGYACSCSSGYEGNPYVVGGCTDIDECRLNKTYPCYGHCQNTPGSYICQCQSGTYGNAYTGPCIRIKKFSGGLSFGLGLGGGTILLLVALGGPFIMHKIKQLKIKKMKQDFFNQNHGLLLQQLISSNTNIGERMIVSLRELEKATDNFESSRVVGRGGHGVVFKGILDMDVVAVKKSNKLLQREIKEFSNEVAILSQVNHRNVMKLLGCCLETEVPMLVYEFISNGTLSSHLHAEGPITLLWFDRIRIALEVARALSYLHSAASMPIFHRDIKSSNVLLDDNLTAKVSDFGASRYIPIDQTGVTTVVQGTLGYLDPMYHYTGRLTDKSDVFSFGVLLVELLTRKQPFIYRSNDGDNLVSHFVKILATSNLSSIIDPQVMEEEDGDLQEVATLANLCIKLRGEDRPTTREVEMTLQNLVKKRLTPCMITPRRTHEHESQVQHMSIELVNNDLSRQYTMEEEILLSATYPR